MMIFSLFIICIMISYPLIFGIDVSKDYLDIHAIGPSGNRFFQVENSAGAIVKWISSLDPTDVLCVLEYTGSYSSRLIHYLSRYGINFSVVTPSQSHGFTQAQGIISKDDQQAARSLALMAQSLDLPLYQPVKEDMKRRKQLLMGINALKKQRQALVNQLHALDNQIIYAPKVVDVLKETLHTVDEHLEELQQELSDLSDEEYKQQFELLTSIKGIGHTTAHLLLSATGGLNNFNHARQLSKFVGVVPWSHKSGTSVRLKGRITKKGNNDLRACLYMAARSAKQYNMACKNLYERLRKIGKPHKQAMVAVMNKLLKQAFGVIHSGVSFDNQYFLKFQTN